MLKHLLLHSTFRTPCACVPQNPPPCRSPHQIRSKLYICLKRWNVDLTGGNWLDGAMCVRRAEPPSPFNVHAFTKMEPQSKIAHTRGCTFQVLLCPFPSLLFSFSSHEPCYPGFSLEAVKEDGEPSYLRMITIVNIHGWFTYHSWLHRHGSRAEASAGVAWWYILHCATMDLCIL